MTIGKASITLSDVTAGNGVIHSIAEVILPKQIHRNVVNNLFKDFEVVNKKAKKIVSLVDLLREKGFTSFHE